MLVPLFIGQADSGWRQGTFPFSTDSLADTCQVPRVDVSHLTGEIFQRIVDLRLVDVALIL